MYEEMIRNTPGKSKEMKKETAEKWKFLETTRK